MHEKTNSKINLTKVFRASYLITAGSSRAQTLLFSYPSG